MSDTPVKVTAHTADGDVDITEGVQALYDLVISSMDWGSGFLSVEDALPVVHVAKTCGFDGWDEAERYVESQRHSEEQRRFTDQRGWSLWDERWRRTPHDHLFSSVGKCMWPGCNATGDPDA